MKYLIIMCLAGFLLVPLASTAAIQKDSTIVLSYSEGKDLMMKQNLHLLAEYYNIEIAQAEIEQARLWNNPLFVWNAEMYNSAMNRYFVFKNQKLIQLEYAFDYSGKRVNAIRQARLGKEIAQLDFANVIRGLIREYSNQFYALHALREKERIYELILSQFDDIIELSSIKLRLGVVSESELLRLRTEHLSIQTYLNGIRSEIYDVEAQLKTLLCLQPSVALQTRFTPFDVGGNITHQALLDSAINYRPDFRMAQLNLDFRELQYKGAKKDAYPSINLGYQPFDQGSNHVRPYHGMVFEMNLPLFNRNQGKIQAAKMALEKEKHLLNYSEQELQNQVFSTYLQYQNAKQIYKSFTPQMLEQMIKLSANSRVNFEKRNISLIEYIDHQRAYIDYQFNLIDATSSYYQSINHIHFIVGKEISL